MDRRDAYDPYDPRAGNSNAPLQPSHTPTPNSALPPLPTVDPAPATAPAPAFAPYHPSSAPSSAAAEYFAHNAHLHASRLAPSAHRRASLAGLSGNESLSTLDDHLRKGGGRGEVPGQGHIPPLQATRYGKSTHAYAHAQGQAPLSPTSAHASPYTTLPPLHATVGRYDPSAPSFGLPRAYGDAYEYGRGEYVHGHGREYGQGHGHGHGYPQTALPLGHDSQWGTRREPGSDWRSADIGAQRDAERGSNGERDRLGRYDRDRRELSWRDDLPASLSSRRPYTPSSTIPSHRQEHMAPPGLSASATRSQASHASQGPTRRASDARTAGRVSPTKVAPAKRGRADESDSDSGDEADKADRSKLEIKREKNRVKQRNLRLRRANLISDLESSNIRLTDETARLEAHSAELGRKSRNLERYVADLEDILSELGYERQVAALQAVWDGIEYAGRDAAGVARGSIASSTGAASAIAGPSAFGPSASSMPPPRTSRFPARIGPSSSLSPKKEDSLHVDASSAPRRISTGSLAHTSGSYFDSPIKGLTPGQTPNTADIAPSPRSLRIEDLLSPSALGPTPGTPGVDSRPSSRSLSLQQQGFHLAKEKEAVDREPGDEVAALVPADMPDFIPLNLNFQVEPWMMEGWLHWGPMEMGDAGGEGKEGERDDGWELTTVEDGMSFGTPTKQQDVVHRPAPHPCIHIARKMLRSIIPESAQPVSEWRFHSLEPVQQRILLCAISQLGDPGMRHEIARQQVDSLAPGLVKALLQYQLDPPHDLRLILMPVAILRARIITFGQEGRAFDLTRFITHVLADARVFGDVGDADGWEMSELFWDVWEGWFPVARKFCASLKGHRRRMGHKGSTPLEIIMGEEQPGARMKGRVGRP